MSKTILKLALLFTSFTLFSQEPIRNLDAFNKFYNQKGKNLIIVGENHSSSVGPIILPELIKYHHQNDNLNSLLIEFGPSEAYFYNKYLESGNDKYLRYTIYGGYYKDWKDAWKKIYDFNQQNNKSLKVYGVDFDRTRTFAYALYNIFKEYKSKPQQIDSLMNVIKNEKFFKTYTIGYPTEKDKQFVNATKSIIKNNLTVLNKMLSKQDSESIKRMLENNAKDFNDMREEDIYKNITSLISELQEKNFLFIVGRDHAYNEAIHDEKNRVATLLKIENNFSTYTGVILHENSKQRGFREDEIITLHEIKNKVPWKSYKSLLLKKSIGDITIIPLSKRLSKLKKYLDFVIVAKNQRELKIK